MTLREADLAVATLTGQRPLVPVVGEDPDAYLDAFVHRYEGWGSSARGERAGVRVVLEPWLRNERLVAFVWLDEEDLGAELTVSAGGLACAGWGWAAPSVAHAFLAWLLEDDELAALAERREGWLGARARVDRVEPSVRGRAFELDRRSPWAAGLVSGLLVSAGAALLALDLWVIGRAPWLAWWLWLSLGAGVLAVGLWLARSVVRHLAARALDIDERGFFDPHAGARVRWEDTMLLDDRRGTMCFRLSDGRELTVPDDTFVDARVTIAVLAERCRGGGGYRRA